MQRKWEKNQPNQQQMGAGQGHNQNCHEYVIGISRSTYMSLPPQNQFTYLQTSPAYLKILQRKFIQSTDFNSPSPEESTQSLHNRQSLYLLHESITYQFSTEITLTPREISDGDITQSYQQKKKRTYIEQWEEFVKVGRRVQELVAGVDELFLQLVVQRRHPTGKLRNELFELQIEQNLTSPSRFQTIRTVDSAEIRRR